jgi:hypothetical protein
MVFRMTLSGKLTEKLVENLGAGRHGDGRGLKGRWNVAVLQSRG